MRPTEGEKIRVAVAGAAGKMGSETCRTVSAAVGMELVGAIDKVNAGKRLREVAGSECADLVIEEKYGATLDAVKPHVVVDFTHPSVAAENALNAIKRSIAPVVGTSGVGSQGVTEIKLACQDTGVPAMIVPNFAIGAVLMMKFTELAAKWMPQVEIIELHHDEKADAPSGTALRTADIIYNVRQSAAPASGRTDIFKIEGARGANSHGVQIHSVRLRGLVAHQEVLFGGPGELLTIKHDSLSRASFMEGVKMCVREIWNREGLTIGLDALLF